MYHGDLSSIVLGDDCHVLVMYDFAQHQHTFPHAPLPDVITHTNIFLLSMNVQHRFKKIVRV